jgi:hypothetical protein
MTEPELTEDEANDRAERLSACCYLLASLHVNDPAPFGVWASEVVAMLGSSPEVVARARKLSRQESSIVRVTN